MALRAPTAALVLPLLAALATAATGACEAELEEGCEGGPCTGATVGTGSPVGQDCPEGGGLPCDVLSVLANNCHACHTDPPQNGAPFPLLRFEHTQVDYGSLKVWEVMALAVEPDGGGQRVPMPLGSNPMEEASIQVLRDWFATCRTGACEQIEVTTTSSAGTSGSASASSTSTGAECGFEDTNDLPCDVFTVLAEECHGCHTDPPANGAPFPLLTYEDTQADFFGRTVWDRMQDAVEPGAIPGMPFGNNPMAEEKIQVLRDWFATCDAGECARDTE